jgi:hypothetical protein
MLRSVENRSGGVDYRDVSVEYRSWTQTTFFVVGRENVVCTRFIALSPRVREGDV